MKKMTVFPSNIKGVVKVSGSKNAALPIIAASVITSSKTVLKNIANISDINNLLTILEKVGLSVKRKNDNISISGFCNEMPLMFDEVKKFRASYYLMSVYLALFKNVCIYLPGGCKIGNRPIDFHLEGFKSAGCVVKEEGDVIEIYIKELIPFTYVMPKKSLGATVNMLILASKIDGKSVIKNASTEPEIDDLISFINKGCAKVLRKGNDIIIYGNPCFKTKIKHKVMPDRIEAFTYICIGANAKKIKIKKINLNHLEAPLQIIKNANFKYKKKKNALIIYQSELKPINVVSDNYPYLSTDQMPLLYPLFTRVEGESVFKETIFKERFLVCEELKKTGADICVCDGVIKIIGVSNLHGNDFYPTDLRCAASLLIEAIINGNSTINNLEYLERGYDRIYEKLRRIKLNFKID